MEYFEYTRPRSGEITSLPATNQSIVDSLVMAGSRSICTEAGHELQIKTCLKHCTAGSHHCTRRLWNILLYVWPQCDPSLLGWMQGSFTNSRYKIVADMHEPSSFSPPHCHTTLLTTLLTLSRPFVPTAFPARDNERVLAVWRRIRNMCQSLWISLLHYCCLNCYINESDCVCWNVNPLSCTADWEWDSLHQIYSTLNANPRQGIEFFFLRAIRIIFCIKNRIALLYLESKDDSYFWNIEWKEDCYSRVPGDRNHCFWPSQRVSKHTLMKSETQPASVVSINH